MSSRILMIVTSNARMGDTGKPTGLWAEELAVPYYALVDAGAEVTLAVALGLVLLAALVLGYVLHKAITVPMARLVQVHDNMRTGNLSGRLDLHRSDEFVVEPEIKARDTHQGEQQENGRPEYPSGGHGRHGAHQRQAGQQIEYDR